MTVYAVRIKCSTQQASNPSAVPSPSPPDLKDVLHDRVKKNVFGTLTEKLAEQSQAPSVVNTAADESGTDHIRAVYRVSGDDAKDDVLDELENGALADADWYRIEFHTCDHDDPDDQQTGCGNWQTEREQGSIPSDV